MSDITDDFYGDLIIEDAKIVEEMNYKSKAKKLIAKADYYENTFPIVDFTNILRRYLKEEITIRKFRDLVIDKIKEKEIK
jgi:hypothetical protein